MFGHHWVKCTCLFCVVLLQRSEESLTFMNHCCVAENTARRPLQGPAGEAGAAGEAVPGSAEGEERPQQPPQPPTGARRQGDARCSRHSCSPAAGAVSGGAAAAGGGGGRSGRGEPNTE